MAFANTYTIILNKSDYFKPKCWVGQGDKVFG